MAGEIEVGYVDEGTLDEYDVENEREIELNATRRSTVPFPSVAPDGRPLEVYFREAKEAFKGKAAIPAVRKLVLCVDLSPSEKGLGASPAKLLAKLRGAGWPRVTVQSSIVAVSDSFYMDDSKKKPGQEAPDNRKGDLKKPAHLEKHWWIEGVAVRYRMAVSAHWTEGVTPKGGRSFTFKGAVAADPVGMPTELHADYSPSADDKARAKNEPNEVYERRLAIMEANARRLDRDYNTGEDYLNFRPSFKAYTPFEAWLDEAIMMTTPRAAA